MTETDTGTGVRVQIETLPDDPLELATEFARLAPSPRNIQPWAIERRGDDLRIFLDRSRSRPVADPHGRELIISCGVLLRFVTLALEASGSRYDVSLYPDQHNPDLLAEIALADQDDEPDQSARELVTIAMGRRTNWDGYLDRPLSEATRRQLAKSVVDADVRLTAVDAVHRIAVENLISSADYRQMSDPRFIQELRRWPTGRPTAIVEENEPVRDATAESPVPAERRGELFVLGTAGDHEEYWVKTGEALADFLLEVTRLGLRATFCNQPVQLQNFRSELESVLVLNSYVQQVIRVGYGASSGKRTARRSVEEISQPRPQPW